MPNRLIKESICTSEDLNKLSNEAEILFYRLIVQVDDFGCYFGNPSIVKSRCFPLRTDDIKSEQVDCWLNELARVGLIIRYTAEDGRNYLCFTKWGKHQTIRATQRKFPEPKEDDFNRMQLQADDFNCMQPISDDSECLRNPIHSYSNSYSYSESDSIDEQEPQKRDEQKPQKRKARKKVEFVPPTLEEVREYAKSKEALVDPDYFYEYYTLSHWTDKGGKPIQNWKQVFLNWERREKKEEQKPQKRNKVTTAKEYKPPNSTIDVSLLNKIKEVGL